MTTTHDPLCPRADIGYLPNVACWCDEIAKVRADERGRVLREAREAVGDRYDWQRNEFAPWGIKPLPDDQRFLDGIDDALNAIDRLVAQEVNR